MPDRRHDKRFRLTEPTQGVLRTFLDVIVQRTAHDEWMGLSREAAVIGELLVLDVAPDQVGAGGARTISVRVIDSQPIIVNGEVRHRIRLRRTDLTPILFEPKARQN